VALNSKPPRLPEQSRSDRMIVGPKGACESLSPYFRNYVADATNGPTSVAAGVSRVQPRKARYAVCPALSARA
jgi:hypothetical protein